jgi:hypothetical protein
VVGAVLVGSGFAVVRSRGSANAALSPPMEFGIYPGGPVGTINITDAPVAENPAQRLAALKALRASSATGTPRPFVVRLYESFTGWPTVDAWTGTGANATTDSEITSYSDDGFDIDLVVRYEPVKTLGSSAVDDYLTFVRKLVQHYGPNSNVRFLQIANEVNETSSAESSDGAYPGAEQALVWGVEAAAQQAANDGHPHLEVGFNWAYALGSGVDKPLWKFIKSQGLSFQKSVSWVGLDEYPGSFSDVKTPAARTGSILDKGVSELRNLMDQSGLSRSVSIHISETGYPTGPKRSGSSQVVGLSSLVNSVNAVRGPYNISDFEWFDLRDSNSAIPNKQEQYGLMTDRYKAKPAFWAYKRLVSSLGQ